MLKAYKTEINPTIKQKNKINQSIGVCRWLYNSYIAKNRELYKSEEKLFMSAYDFDKYINNEIKVLDEYKWINNCSSKARKKAICDAEIAYKRFFKGQSKFPRFKKKNKSDVKMYFVKTDSKTIIPCERHRIKIPTLGWIRLKEKGYIPTNKIIKSGAVSRMAGRYYVSVLIDEEEPKKTKLNEFGIGIDLGIKDFAICSDGETYKNINKTKEVRSLEKRLKREQRRLSRKYESLKQKNKIKGGATRQNIQKQIAKVQKLHQRLTNIRTDYINKTVNEIVKQKPSYITIEDLNVSGMMKNRHLSKVIAKQKFYEFRNKLEFKCKLFGIELRVVDRFYPSSKLCHECGCVKSDLKLSDRIYTCNECGYEEDRDINASLNLRDVKIYKVA